MANSRPRPKVDVPRERLIRLLRDGINARERSEEEKAAPWTSMRPLAFPADHDEACRILAKEIGWPMTWAEANNGIISYSVRLGNPYATDRDFVSQCLKAVAPRGTVIFVF